MSDTSEIGGGTSSTGYLLIFVAGVLIGTAVRAAMALLPSSVIAAIRKRVLPGE